MFRFYSGDFEIAKIKTCRNFVGYFIVYNETLILELQENDLPYTS